MLLNDPRKCRRGSARSVIEIFITMVFEKNIVINQTRTAISAATNTEKMREEHDMGTAQTKTKGTKTTANQQQPPADTGMKHVTTVTTERIVKPIESAEPAQQPAEVVVLTPQEAMIEEIRRRGDARDFTITIWRLENYYSDGRTDTRAKGRKWLTTIDWDVDTYESEIQHRYGEGAYLIEVKKDKKFTKVSFVFECEDPIDAPPLIAQNQYQQPGQAYPMMDPMQQMESAFQMIERIMKVVGSKMAAVSNPAPALPQIIQPPAPAASQLDVLMQVASSENPVLLKLGKFLFGGGEVAEAGESATNMYDVVQTISQQVPWGTLLNHFASSLNKPMAPAAPGQPQPQPRAMPPAQLGQPPVDQNVGAPTSAGQDKVAVDTQPMDFNTVAQTFMNDLCHNTPIDHVASLITQLTKEQPPVGAELASLLSLSPDKVWEAIVQLWPDMKKWEGLTHKLTWIENLQAKLKPAEQGANGGTNAVD